MGVHPVDSGWRIDLEGIWRLQSLPTKLADAVDSAAHAARRHLVNAPGGRNVTEWSKNEACWAAFSRLKITLPCGWEGEWAAAAFVTTPEGGDSLAARWDKIRVLFTGDPRLMGELAFRHGVKWPAARWNHPAGDYAALTWERLRLKRAFGTGKLVALVEILEAAAGEPVAAEP